MEYPNGQGMNGTGVALEPLWHQSVQYDRNRSVHAILREQARQLGSARAIIFGDESVTYGELDSLSDALAAYLVGLGVRKGETVGLFLPRALNTIIAKLAILKAGGAYLPIDPAFPPEHLEYVIAECAPKVIFTDDAHFENIRALANVAGSVVNLARILPGLACGAPFEGPAVGGDDIAYVMYTSGSTGRPKGVAIPHRGITRLVLSQDYVGFASSDVVLHTATIAFDAATFEIWGALLNGSLLVGMPEASFSLARLCEVIRDNRVTVTLLTTGLFNLFADYASGGLPSLRHVLFGGEVGSAEHVRRFQSAYPGCRLTNAYGPTESTVIATAFTVPPAFGEQELPVGEAIAHTGILILDEDLRPLPAGIEGQLAISGDGLAIGYFNRDDLTDEKFVPIETPAGLLRCYLTGDLAVMGADGMLVFKGRRDRQIKINGKRIELDEIEAALRRDPRLLDGVVVCHAQGPSAKRIVAYLRPLREADIDDPGFARAVMAKLRSALPAYMIPSAAVVLKEFPLTQAGKVERSKLLPPPDQDMRIAEPKGRSEEILAKLWQEVLGVEGVEIERNFFDLGGTSLQLLRVHAALEVALARTVDIFALFKHPTIRELAQYLDGKALQAVRGMSADQRAAQQRRTIAMFRRSAP